jgi:shikimate 5-dehydrogenase
VLDPGALGGRMVIDAVYGVETPLVRDARRRGLEVADGLELLVAQGVLQFERLTGRTARADVLGPAARAWLAARA